MLLNTIRGTHQVRRPVVHVGSPVRERQSGAAMIEFALVLPLLLVLLMGIIDFGLYFYNDLQLTHVARDAARYASVNRLEQARDVLNAARLVSVTAAALTVPPEADTNQGEPLTVTATGTYNFVTPLPAFVLSFFDGGLPGTLPIRATAIMRME